MGSSNACDRPRTSASLSVWAESWIEVTSMPHMHRLVRARTNRITPSRTRAQPPRITCWALSPRQRAHGRASYMNWRHTSRSAAYPHRNKHTHRPCFLRIDTRLEGLGHLTVPPMHYRMSLSSHPRESLLTTFTKARPRRCLRGPGARRLTGRGARRRRQSRTTRPLARSHSTWTRCCKIQCVKTSR